MVEAQGCGPCTSEFESHPSLMPYSFAPYVLGWDYRVHGAEHHVHESLSACDRVVAIRPISENELTFMAEWYADRMCSKCFTEVTDVPHTLI